MKSRSFFSCPLALLVVALGLAHRAHAQIEFRGTQFSRFYAPVGIGSSTSPLAGLSLTDGGTGYTVAPTVSIAGGGGTGATATASIAAGAVTGFTLTNVGSGYTSAPTVSITGGNGTGATAVVVFRYVPDSGGTPAITTPQFAGVIASSGGSAAISASTDPTLRYASQIYLIAGTSTPSGIAIVRVRAVFGASFAAGVPRYSFGDIIAPPATKVDGVLLADASYWRSQPVRLGEVFTQSTTPTSETKLPLTISSITVTAGGSGYTSVPTVLFSGGGGSGATATAVVTQGIVTGITLTNAGANYSTLPAVTLSGGGGSGATAEATAPRQPFYYSPHADKVFASASGRVSLWWVTRAPVATETDPVARYRYKEEIFSVSSSTQRPTRTIYWTERSFTGPVVSVPTGKIETINPVYSTNFPSTVAAEYQPVGVINPVNPNAAPPVERRTLWIDNTAGIGQLRAYNHEGRILIEYLGALKQGQLNVHEFVGADVLDVVRVANPVEVAVYLGDQLTPRDDSGVLLPRDGSSEWEPSPLASTGSPSGSQPLYGTTTRKDGRKVYYAERENLTPDRIAFYWMERNDAAIHFTGSIGPDVGILWPRIKNHYTQVWPSDVTKFAHYTVPAGGSAAATGIQFEGGQLPQVVFQDDPSQTEARIDASSQRVVVSVPVDGANRALLKFTSANEVWYVRLLTQTEVRPRTIAVTQGGAGYTSAPTVSFTNGGTGATAVANVADGRVVSITLTSPGQNFTSTTQVVLSHASGSGATAIIGEPGYQEGDGLTAISATVNVGDRIPAPPGYEAGGYIASGDNYYPAAYADPFTVGATAAAGRAIIPVNAIPGKNVLKVWWFRKVTPPGATFQSFFVPAKIGTYTAVYPVNPAAIVLASNSGSGDLSPAELAGSLYFQNDRTLPGFNPNEEHAVLLAGRAYALRDDLNDTSANPATYTSEPFVLLGYTHPTDSRPAMRVFKVLRERDVDGTVNDQMFNFAVTAGTMLQAPMPLPLLPLPLAPNGQVANTEVAGISDVTPHNSAPDHYARFTFKDRKGFDWVYRGPPGAMPVNSLSLAESGRGYTSAPTVGCTGGGGSGAAATATMANGEVVAITVTNPGSGYTSAPTVTFTGGGATTEAAAIANVGPTLGMQFYYTMREGFFVPGRTTQPAIGTVLPYLRPLAAGSPTGDPVTGTSLTIVYRPVWPVDAPELRIAESLMLPKFGLPAIFTQTSARVLYQQSIASAGAERPSAILHDPIREKTFPLGTLNQLGALPASVITSSYQGKLYLQGVPPHLQDRIFFDANRGTKGALVLTGEFIDEIAGEDYLSLNVLSPEDVVALKAICASTDADKSKWDHAVDSLVTRLETFVENPQQAGSYQSDGSPVVVGPRDLARISSSDTAVVNYALTATGQGSGWISMIFGDGLAFTPGGEPVSLSVFKVAPRLHTGELKVEPSGNPLDEMVSLRHSGDFAARPENYEFDWRYAPGGAAPPVYTYAMSPVATSTWQFVANPAGARPSAAEYAALPVTVVGLPFALPIRTDAARLVTRPGRVARRTTHLDFTAGIPGRVVFSIDLSDTNAGFVLYLNGSVALAHQAPAPFVNALSATGLVADGLAKQFEVDGNAFQNGANIVELALFTTSDVNASAAINARFHVSAETDNVAAGLPWVKPDGTLLNQVTVGGSPTAPLGNPLLVLTDNYFTMRYRPKIGQGNILAPGADQDAVPWSRWMPAKLVEGWIKRVLAGINPLNQRVTDLYNNAVNTDISLLTQAGKRWEGNISLNLSNITEFGLIEIYETVLNRGKNISVDSGFNYGPANDALLLAAGYLNDLYTVLGNEAYADAVNPTISMDDAGSSTEVNTSRFSFEGQVKSVLEEELGLLRGRDDFQAPGVIVSPAYHRLYWNYTRGITSGEALYAVNYNIREKSGSTTADGTIDAGDAQRMFPQGHGDAYGHYLTALKGYTRLLQHPSFTWTPRSEAVTVLGQAVQIDYFDERKFAAAAVALGRTATQILSLTHRQSYRDNPGLGWGHYRDGITNPNTGVTRHWGVDEWTARSTQGAYFNWILGNTMLPDVDNNPQHTGVQVIDRTTVPELRELPAFGEEFQTRIDNVNSHLNPLGLSPSAIAFDISPTELKSGKSHYEQIHERALRAVLNAKGAFDQAARMTRLLRNQENQLATTNIVIEDDDYAAFVELTELYGTPYAGDIGPGKTYAQGFYGPDLINWFIIERPTDMIDTTVPVSMSVNVAINFKVYSGFDAANVSTSYNTPTEHATKTITVQPGQFVQYADVWATTSGPMGARVVTGAIQQALGDFHTEFVSLRGAIDDILDMQETFRRRYALYQEMLNARIASLAKQTATDAEILRLSKLRDSFLDSGRNVNAVADGISNTAHSLAEFFPKVFGLSNDATSGIRGGLLLAASVLADLMRIRAVGHEADADRQGISILQQEQNLARDLGSIGFSYEQKQFALEYEMQYRELVGAHYELAARASSVQRALENVRNLIARGDRLQLDREVVRKRAAVVVQGLRTKDFTFRVFRNEALEQYRSLYDLAARYTYLAAKSYDYETGLLGSAAGQSTINAIVASRSLGDLTGGVPQATVSTLGDSGLAGTMARLQADWSVAKPRLGINNPDTNGTLFSLRRELFRLVAGTAGDTAWQQTLEQHVMSNVMADPDVAAHARSLRKADGSAVPGIVIPFSTTIQQGMNFFGLPSAVGDHNYSVSNYATKIYSVGMVLPGYIGMDPYAQLTPGAGSPNTTAPNGLNATPYVYLIPTGTDYMLAPPLGDTGEVRAFDVHDQALPLPFNLGATSFSSTQFFNASGTLNEAPWVLRKHQAFRPVSDPAFFYGTVPSEFTSSRLVGRSAWNGGWKIVIPAYSLLSNEPEGLNRFVASVKDIELFLRTYSHSGN